MKRKLIYSIFLSFLGFMFVGSQAMAQAPTEQKQNSSFTGGAHQPAVAVPATERNYDGSSTANPDYRPASGVALTSKVVTKKTATFSVEVMGMDQNFINGLKDLSSLGMSVSKIENLFSNVEIDEKNHRVTVQSSNPNMNELEVLDFFKMIQNKTRQGANPQQATH